MAEPVPSSGLPVGLYQLPYFSLTANHAESSDYCDHRCMTYVNDALVAISCKKSITYSSDLYMESHYTSNYYTGFHDLSHVVDRSAMAPRRACHCRLSSVLYMMYTLTLIDFLANGISRAIVTGILSNRHSVLDMQ